MKLSLTAVVTAVLFPIFFCSGDHNQCDRYKFMDGIEIHPSKCIFRNCSKPESSKMCMAFCNEWTGCTGVAVDTNESTSWCCLLNGKPIEISRGQHVLYRRKAFPTRCVMFGYKPNEACTECLQEGIWSGYAQLYAQVHTVQFRLTFAGKHCSTVTGLAEGDMITQGVLNATTKSVTMVTQIRTYEVTVNTENNRINGVARTNTASKTFYAEYVGAH